MMQTPAPNLPPPGTYYSNHVPEWVPYFVALLLVVCVVVWMVMPLIRAWAKRIEARALDSAALDELAHMREQIAELALSDARVRELEERLDFAERLLATQRADARVPLHRTPV